MVRRRPGDGADLLAEATSVLRRHTPDGWSAVRGDLLDLARRAHRASAPVRGRHEHGDFLVATDVLVGALRRSVGSVPDVAVTAVHCASGRDAALTGVTVEITALFGTHLPTAGEAARAVVRATLVEVLGELSPPAEQVLVHVHVHVGDVVARRTDL
ncbi:hypothetical protein AB2L28_03565 [Kineococcus sp. TBRC 1896]|uniref:Asp23/Gls24 family envelope stress response protein n=1 Tax=Kineococcus mangrovi TaxID=1660183 RepID=A0ABV4I272_9ACTN